MNLIESGIEDSSLYIGTAVIPVGTNRLEYSAVTASYAQLKLKYRMPE